jgi:type II secretory pathway pseudopilin PulG
VVRAGFSRHRAFALIDVIVGAILMAVALAAIIALTGRALSSQKQGEELQTAAMLADEQLSLVLARGPDDYDRRFSTRGVCDAPFSDFSYDLDFRGGSGRDPFVVTATIAWSGTGGARSLAIQTLIAPREGDDPDPDRVPPEIEERAP